MANPLLLDNRFEMLASYWPYNPEVQTPKGLGVLNTLSGTTPAFDGPFDHPPSVLVYLRPSAGTVHPYSVGFKPEEVKPLLYTLDQLEHILPNQDAVRHVIGECVPLNSDGPYGEYAWGPITVTGGQHQVMLSFNTGWNVDYGDNPDDIDDSVEPEDDGVYASYDLLLDNIGSQLYRQNKGPWQVATGGLYVYQYLRSLHVAVGTIYPAYQAEPKYFVRKELPVQQEGAAADA
ncbi:hypothetical protein [uncultured Hymenobacter sp.]|uniref:hypothetical protein n=1 Tax=uncultured Hymenobacter sp. TaxID=170016 RepID=UPI0035CB50B3